MAGEVEDAYATMDARRAAFGDYLRGMGFTNIALTVGGKTLGNESNVIVAQYDEGPSRKGCMISAVHDRIQYLIRYEGDLDDTAKAALDRLLPSFQFPTLDQVKRFVSSLSEPSLDQQVVLEVLKAGSPEEARRILDKAGMPPVISRPAYTIHQIGKDPGRKKPARCNVSKWWQFWK